MTKTMANTIEPVTRCCLRPFAHSLYLLPHPLLCPFPPSCQVVYVCGGWDLFSAGHIAALQEARKLGDFLLVGACL